MAYAKSDLSSANAVKPGSGTVIDAPWTPSMWVTTDNRGRAVARFTVDAPPSEPVVPLLLAISRVLRSAFARNIDAGNFAPLSAARLRQKTLRGYPLAPLIATGLLRSSLAGRNSQGNVTYITSERVLVVGSNLPYAAVHQTGGGNGIPARPYLSIGDGDWARINTLINDYVATRKAPAAEGV